MPPSGPGEASPISGPPDSLGLGFLDGVSCFETLRFYGGRAFCLKDHLARLRESCAGLGRSCPDSEEETERFLRDAVRESGFPDAIVRVSFHWAGNDAQQVAIVRPFAGHPPEWYDQGVDFVSSVLRRPSPRAADPQLKVSQYVSGVLATLDLMGSAGAGSPRPGSGAETAPRQSLREILFLGDSGSVAEGTVSNLFLVRRGSVLTPSAASGILKGVTRSVVMGLARRGGLPVEETQVTRHDLYNADECWMTNTSSEILPVTRIDGRTIGDGRPGPVTRRLAAEFKTEVKRFLS